MSNWKESAMTDATMESTSSGSTTGLRPVRWWQWLLVYPGIVGAVLAAIPTLMEVSSAYSLGVPFGRSAEAREQNRMWQENFNCVRTAEFKVVKTTVNQVEIGSVVCESGDVLLRAKRPEWDRPQHRWVAWSDVAGRYAARTNWSVLSAIFGTAYAAEPAGGPWAQASTAGSVLCQRWLANGRLLQRIRTPVGCVDQIVNTYTGQVISSRPAPCEPSCQ